jgi:BCD family chlorophyll transporter-like MFS transporter
VHQGAVERRIEDALLAPGRLDADAAEQFFPLGARLPPNGVERLAFGLGQVAAGMAFLLVGAGLQTSQTAGLALATDQASEETRPRVVALLYTMLLVGAVSGSLIFSVLLSDFTPEHLVQVVQGSALVVLVLNAIALWKQEPRNPQRVAALKNQVQPK